MPDTPKHPIIEGQAQPSRPSASSTVWSDRPLLRELPNRRYDGRLVVEVWEDNSTRVAIDGAGDTAKALTARALKALQEPFSPIRDPEIPLTNEPVTAAIADVTFLGRLIVELWDDQATIGISGSDPRVLTTAVKTLKAIY